MIFRDLFLTILSVLFFINISGQGTYEGNVWLLTQQEVDDFGVNQYSIIDGKLTIQGNDILDLTPLQSITHIKDDLVITSTENLTNLNGLNNLETIGPGFVNSAFAGDFTLQYTEITNLDDLSSLNIVSSKLKIFSNDNLTNIGGLSNLHSVFRQIEIENNDQLANLNGLSGLSNIIGIDIIGNESLSSIAGLSSTNTELTGRLVISHSPNLIDLTGIEHITHIDGELRLHIMEGITSLEKLSNLLHVGWIRFISIPQITSLTGLDNLNSTGTAFQVRYCDQLTDFCAVNNLFQISPPSYGGYWVANNAFNPSRTDLLAGICTANPTIHFSYPKENDYYVSGEIIRLQFESLQNIPVGAEFEIKYSTNNGLSWVDSNTFNYSELSGGGYDWSAPVFDDIEMIMVRITSSTGISGNYGFTSIFYVQPLNHFNNLGLVNDGISELAWPLEHSQIDPATWYYIIGANTHTCADSESQDWNYTNFEQECGLTITSPFDGKVLYAGDAGSLDSYSCGFNKKGTGYGKQIVIQSAYDSSMAFRMAHLKNIESNIQINQDVNAGQILGEVGGSGTPRAHVHCTLYKNIYQWLPFSANVNSIRDVLKTGSSFTYSGSNPTTLNDCNNAEIDFAAEFRLNNPDRPMSAFQVIMAILNENYAITSGNFGPMSGGAIGIGPVIPAHNDEAEIDIELITLDFENYLNEQWINFKGQNNLKVTPSESCFLFGAEIVLKEDSEIIIGEIKSPEIFYDVVSSLSLEPDTRNPSLDKTVQDIIVIGYPNPTQDIVYFDELENRISSISIYNMQGKHLKKTVNQKSISLSHLANGIYNIIIELEDSRTTSLIISKI